MERPRGRPHLSSTCPTLAGSPSTVPCSKGRSQTTPRARVPRAGRGRCAGQSLEMLDHVCGRARKIVLHGVDDHEGVGASLAVCGGGNDDVGGRQCGPSRCWTTICSSTRSACCPRPLFKKIPNLFASPYLFSPTAHQNGELSLKRMFFSPALVIIAWMPAFVKRFSRAVPKRSRASVRIT